MTPPARSSHLSGRLVSRCRIWSCWGSLSRRSAGAVLCRASSRGPRGCARPRASRHCCSPRSRYPACSSICSRSLSGGLARSCCLRPARMNSAGSGSAPTTGPSPRGTPRPPPRWQRRCGACGRNRCCFMRSLAALVAASRVVMGAHYLSDVVMGGFIGIVVSRTLAAAYARGRLPFRLGPLPGRRTGAAAGRIEAILRPASGRCNIRPAWLCASRLSTTFAAATRFIRR